MYRRYKHKHYIDNTCTKESVCNSPGKYKIYSYDDPQGAYISESKLRYGLMMGLINSDNLVKKDVCENITVCKPETYSHGNIGHNQHNNYYGQCSNKCSNECSDECSNEYNDECSEISYDQCGDQCECNKCNNNKNVVIYW